MKFEVNIQPFKRLLKPILNNSNYGKDILQVVANNEGIRLQVVHGDVTVQLNSSGNNHKDLQYICHEQGCGAVSIHDLALYLKALSGNKTILVEFPRFTTIKVLPLSEKVEIGLAVEYAVTGNELPDKRFKQFTIERQRFVDALKAVRFAIGNEIAKPYYHGIFLKASNGRLLCYAGNGGLYAAKTVQCNLDKTESSKKLLLPTKSINCIISAFNSISRRTINISTSGDGTTYILTSSDLELGVSRVPSVNSQDVEKVILYRYPHKLCMNIKDLKQPINWINGAVKMDKEIFPKPVDINVDNSSGKMVLRCGATAQSHVPLNLDSVLPTTNNSSLKLRCESYALEAVYNAWSGHNQIEMHCEFNSAKPILVEPKNKEAIGSDEPDVIFFATLKTSEDSQEQIVKNENNDPANDYEGLNNDKKK